MRWSSREKALKRRAQKKQLFISKSPIDGTFSITLAAHLPILPEEFKIVPWGKRDKTDPPTVQIYEAASRREVEQFVRQFVPPWSRDCDREVTIAFGKALLTAADIARTSVKRRKRRTALDESQIPTNILEALLRGWDGRLH